MSVSYRKFSEKLGNNSGILWDLNKNSSGKYWETQDTRTGGFGSLESSRFYK